MAMNKKEFDRLVKAYPSLDARELTLLGDCYFQGKVTKQDVIQSFRLYSEAAAKDFDEAKIRLTERVSQYSKINNGVTKRLEVEELLKFEALAGKYLEEMALKEHIPSMLVIGGYLVNDPSPGHGDHDPESEEFKKGERLLMRAFEKGEPQAAYILGRGYLAFCDYEKAARILAMAAEKGHPDALDAIVDVYNPSHAYGLKDMAEYKRWLKIKKSHKKPADK